MQNKSVEPNVANFYNTQLKNYGVDYKLEQEGLNSQIDDALKKYNSKSGGEGGNRPDVRLLKQDGISLKNYPVVIEYKGYKDRLVKLDKNHDVDILNAQNEPNFKNISSYAVNGAVHYARAILHHTDYDEVIAIGITGHKDELGKLQTQIGVYYVSRKNFDKALKVGDFSDLSFLKDENFPNFSQELAKLNLSPEERERISAKKDEEISTALTRLNNDIYKEEKGLSENDRVYLVVATIIATLGIPDKVAPLQTGELKSSSEYKQRDGDKILGKIEAFLQEKDLPEDKQSLISRTLANTLTAENINQPTNGESQLKRVFIKIVDSLGKYYKSELSTDFTGKLFNEMYSWLGFTQDQLNDVVLTPPYVAKLLVQLARVNRDSYVWDFATGSAGLLIQAMNEMIDDAKAKIKSPEELKRKIAHIKAEQLLGLEVLSSVYMLAVLNMILMGDGSANILNQDSLRSYDGHYGFKQTNEKFPATAFVLNPPYSAAGNGMIFVQKALKMMSQGYAAIIIQNSAGTGKAVEFNREILKTNTLIASIKMPIDLFIGKSNVQTQIYVFRVGEAHKPQSVVRFINFSEDGYTRANRKKAKSSLNLRDTNNAKERYRELVQVVEFGEKALKFIDKSCYYEGEIDPKNGADWNQSAPIDTQPKLEDFKKSVSDYLAWEVSQILKNQQPKKPNAHLIEKLNSVKWAEFRIGDLFEKIKTNSVAKNGVGDLPATTAVLSNNQIGKYIARDNATILKGVFSATGNGTGKAFYQPNEFTTFQDSYAFKFKNDSIKIDKIHPFIISALNEIYAKYDWNNKSTWNKIKEESIKLPITPAGEADFAFMESFIAELEAERIAELEAYLRVSGFKDTKLTKAEEEALDDFEQGTRKIIKWAGFQIADLFELKNAKGLDKNKLSFSSTTTDFEFIGRTSANNGVQGYVNLLSFPANPKNTFSIIQIGEVIAQYRDKNWYSSQNIFALTPKNSNLINVKFFIVSSLNATLKKYSGGYSSYPTAKSLRNDIIQLPITPAGEPDFEFMQSFISAIQKVVISGVNDYAEQKIQATKQVVGR